MTLNPSPPRRRRPGRIVYQIIWEGRRFHLRKPIDLTVQHRGPYCFIGYEAAAIEGYGRNEQEALESFADVFAATWDGYATENDRGLSGDARDLKRKLLALVAEVEAAQ